MNLTTENIILIGSLLLLVSVIAGRVSYKYGVPTLLLFLVVGMLAGADGIVGIRFDNPNIAQFIGVISLNFILFSGGFDTSWNAVKPILKEGITLSTLGVLLTAFSLGGFVFWITDLTLYESLLLGSIVSSTDAAAVFSLLRSKSLTLKSNLRPTLELESGSNDPMAYVLTIAFLGLVVNQDSSIYSVIPVFFQQMILGGIAGFVFGQLSKKVINRIKIDYEGLYPVLVIALMFITFSATDFLGGNGFLAVYICGIFLGNQDLIHKKSIVKAFDGFTWLVQIVLFLTLGLLVNPSDIIPVLGIGLLVSLFLILVARPLSVFISLIPFKMKMERRFYISWVGLRGAVPIVFATYPLLELAGTDKEAVAKMIFNIVFFISVTSLLIQGTTLAAVAKWLGVALPEKENPLATANGLLSEQPKTVMKEVGVRFDCRAVNKKIVDLKLPKEVVIAMVKRKDKYLTPSGSTVIEADDILIVLSDSQKDIDNLSDHLNHLQTKPIKK